jgi:hypothetical protein
MSTRTGGPAWTRRLWRPLPYALRRGPIADATAHERRLRGDGFGDGFGGDVSLVGRSTGGTFGPVVASAAPSEVGSRGSLRLRVASSSPASRVARLLLRRLAPMRVTRAGAQRRSPIVELSPRMSHWFRGAFARSRALSFGFFRF